MAKRFPSTIHNPEKNVPSDISTQFFLELKNGDLDQIRSFVIDNNVKLNLTEYGTGKNPYHIVLEINDSVADSAAKLRLLRYLDTTEAPIDLPDKDNVYPIHLAAKLQDKDIMDFFMKKKIDTRRTDSSNNTPLHYAINGTQVTCPVETSPGKLVPSQKIEDQPLSTDFTTRETEMMTAVKNNTDISTIINVINIIPKMYENTPLERELEQKLSKVFVDINLDPNYSTELSKSQTEIDSIVSDTFDKIKESDLNNALDNMEFAPNSGGWGPGPNPTASERIMKTDRDIEMSRIENKLDAERQKLLNPIMISDDTTRKDYDPLHDILSINLPALNKNLEEEQQKYLIDNDAMYMKMLFLLEANAQFIANPCEEFVKTIMGGLKFMSKQVYELYDRDWRGYIDWRNNAVYQTLHNREYVVARKGVQDNMMRNTNEGFVRKNNGTRYQLADVKSKFMNQYYNVVISDDYQNEYDKLSPEMKKEWNNSINYAPGQNAFTVRNQFDPWKFRKLMKWHSRSIEATPFDEENVSQITDDKDQTKDGYIYDKNIQDNSKAIKTNDNLYYPFWFDAMVDIMPDPLKIREEIHKKFIVYDTLAWHNKDLIQVDVTFLNLSFGNLLANPIYAELKKDTQYISGFNPKQTPSNYLYETLKAVVPQKRIRMEDGWEDIDPELFNIKKGINTDDLFYDGLSDNAFNIWLDKASNEHMSFMDVFRIIDAIYQVIGKKTTDGKYSTSSYIVAFDIPISDLVKSVDNMYDNDTKQKYPKFIFFVKMFYRYVQDEVRKIIQRYCMNFAEWLKKNKDLDNVKSMYGIFGFTDERLKPLTDSLMYALLLPPVPDLLNPKPITDIGDLVVWNRINTMVSEYNTFRGKINPVIINELNYWIGHHLDYIHNILNNQNKYDYLRSNIYELYNSDTKIVLSDPEFKLMISKYISSKADNFKKLLKEVPIIDKSAEYYTENYDPSYFLLEYGNQITGMIQNNVSKITEEIQKINHVITDIKNSLNLNFYYYIPQLFLPSLIVQTLHLLDLINKYQKNMLKENITIKFKITSDEVQQNDLSIKKFNDELIKIGTNLYFVINYHGKVIDFLNINSAFQIMKYKMNEFNVSNIFTNNLSKIIIPTNINDLLNLKIIQSLLRLYTVLPNTIYFTNKDNLPAFKNIIDNQSFMGSRQSEYQNIISINRAPNTTISNVPNDGDNMQINKDNYVDNHNTIIGQLLYVSPIQRIIVDKKKVAENNQSMRYDFNEGFIGTAKKIDNDIWFNIIWSPSIKSNLDEYISLTKQKIIETIITKKWNNTINDAINDAITNGKILDKIINRVIEYATKRAIINWIHDKNQTGIQKDADLVIPKDSKYLQVILQNIDKKALKTASTKNVYQDIVFELSHVESTPDKLPFATTQNSTELIHHLYSIDYFSDTSNNNSGTKCYRINSELIRKLINSDTVNAINSDGTTPLHLAVGISHPPVVRLLIEKGANPTGSQNNHDNTALDVGLHNLNTHLNFISYKNTLKSALEPFSKPFNDLLLSRLRNEKYNNNILKYITLGVPIQIIMYNHMFQLYTENYRYGITAEMKDNIKRIIGNTSINLSDLVDTKNLKWSKITYSDPKKAALIKKQIEQVDVQIKGFENDKNKNPAGANIGSVIEVLTTTRTNYVTELKKLKIPKKTNDYFANQYKGLTIPKNNGLNDSLIAIYHGIFNKKPQEISIGIWQKYMENTFFDTPSMILMLLHKKIQEYNTYYIKNAPLLTKYNNSKMGDSDDVWSLIDDVIAKFATMSTNNLGDTVYTIIDLSVRGLRQIIKYTNLTFKGLKDDLIKMSKDKFNTKTAKTYQEKFQKYLTYLKKLFDITGLLTTTQVYAFLATVGVSMIGLIDKIKNRITQNVNIGSTIYQNLGLWIETYISQGGITLIGDFEERFNEIKEIKDKLIDGAKTTMYYMINIHELIDVFTNYKNNKNIQSLKINVTIWSTLTQYKNDLSHIVDYLRRVTDYIDYRNSISQNYDDNPILEEQRNQMIYLINLIVTPSVLNIILRQAHDAFKKTDPLDSIKDTLGAIRNATVNGQTIESYLRDILPKRAISFYTKVYQNGSDPLMKIVNENELMTPILNIIKANTKIIIEDDNIFVLNFHNYLVPFILDTYRNFINIIQLTTYGYERYLLNSYQLANITSILMGHITE